MAQMLDTVDQATDDDPLPVVTRFFEVVIIQICNWIFLSVAHNRRAADAVSHTE